MKAIATAWLAVSLSVWHSFELDSWHFTACLSSWVTSRKYYFANRGACLLSGLVKWCFIASLLHVERGFRVFFLDRSLSRMYPIEFSMEYPFFSTFLIRSWSIVLWLGLCVHNTWRPSLLFELLEEPWGSLSEGNLTCASKVATIKILEIFRHGVLLWSQARPAENVAGNLCVPRFFAKYLLRRYVESLHLCFDSTKKGISYGLEVFAPKLERACSCEVSVFVTGFCHFLFWAFFQKFSNKILVFLNVLHAKDGHDVAAELGWNTAFSFSERYQRQGFRRYTGDVG